MYGLAGHALVLLLLLLLLVLVIAVVVVTGCSALFAAAELL